MMMTMIKIMSDDHDDDNDDSGDMTMVTIVTMHWLHLFGISPLCALKRLLKCPALKDAYSHWLHLFDMLLWQCFSTLKGPFKFNLHCLQ